MPNPMMLVSGLGGIASGLGGMFGGGGKKGKNPADAGNPYLDQIPGQTSQYNTPFWQAGVNQLPGLQNQYSGLMNDPGGKLNQIGESYHQSPGFKFALQQALQGSNHAAAAGGMAGSPQHEQQNMQVGTDIANQDFYNWLGKATGLYSQGLNGSQSMANQGQMAGNNIAEMIAQVLSQKSNNAVVGQMQQNQKESSNWGNLLGGIGQTAGSFLF